ncbi:MAG: autotransporter-associated beta strand protein [Pseudoalteromonas tetraodonis]|jgi:autotransporter-associated beta strand protein
MLLRILLLIAFVGISHVQAQQPNVVFIISDDAGFADWGFMDPYTQSINPGQATSPVPTPNLDRLRDRGVLFTNAYTAAVCSPSRAAIMTGSYQQRIGYEFNINNLTDPNGNFEGLRAEDVTIFERMRARGYTTGAIGKWHVGGIRDIVVGGVVTTPGNRPPRQGVDEFFGILRGSRNYQVGPTAGDETRAVREMSLDSNGLEVNNDVEAMHAGEYVTNTFGQGAVDFLDRHYADQEPFFLYVSFTAPHSPIGASPDRNEPGISSNYGSMVFTMDKEIGRIMDKIADPAGDGSIDLTDDTLIIFINDNGGASGIGTRNTPLRDFKGSTYEGGIRVPMIMAGAGVTAAAGSSYSAPVHSIDVLATCHELAGGAPLSDEIDGVNLLPFVNGMDTGVPHKAVVVRSRGRYGIRMGDWKLTRDDAAAPELFDLSINVDETDEANVAALNPDVVAEMLAILTEHEVGFVKPRFHGLGAGANSINRNDRFRFAPVSVSGERFTADLILVAPGTRNGGFESPAFDSDQHGFAEADDWTNIGSGTQQESFIRTNLGRDTPQNAVISQSGGRVAAIDTGHALAEGELFRVSYWWRDASGWSDGSDRIGFTFYTTDDDTIDGNIAASAQVLSEPSTANSAYEFAENVYTAGAGEAGKRLFVSFVGVDGNGSAGGFARVDDVRIERGSMSDGGGGISTQSWSTTGAWVDTDSGETDTLLELDAFSGAVLEFPVAGEFSYNADNDMRRATGETFMLNRIELTGDGNSGTHRARITGNDLLFAPSHDGDAPMIENNATASDFSFSIETALIPWGNLVVSGDGSSGLEISGEISDYNEAHPAGIVKRGTSTLTLGGTHPFSAAVVVEDGILRLDSASLNGLSSLIVAGGGSLTGTGTVLADTNLEGAFQVDLDSADRIDFGGSLNLVGADLVLSGIPQSEFNVLASYGQLIGRFDQVRGLPPGYEIDYAFTGNQVALVRAPDAYVTWAEITSGLSSTDAGFDADPNGDGVANGVAFFLGAPNANMNARGYLPEVSATDSVATFRFNRSPEAAGYAFGIRYSGDLSEWLRLIDGEGGASILVEGDEITAIVPLSLVSGTHLFLTLTIPAP